MSSKYISLVINLLVYFTNSHKEKSSGKTKSTWLVTENNSKHYFKTIREKRGLSAES